MPSDIIATKLKIFWSIVVLLQQSALNILETYLMNQNCTLYASYFHSVHLKFENQVDTFMVNIPVSKTWCNVRLLNNSSFSPFVLSLSTLNSIFEYNSHLIIIFIIVSIMDLGISTYRCIYVTGTQNNFGVLVTYDLDL